MVWKIIGFLIGVVIFSYIESKKAERMEIQRAKVRRIIYEAKKIAMRRNI